MLLVVMASGGSALVTATAMSIDNATGRGTLHLLGPGSGYLPTGLAAPVNDTGVRRRPVRR